MMAQARAREADEGSGNSKGCAGSETNALSLPLSMPAHQSPSRREAWSALSLARAPLSARAHAQTRAPPLAAARPPLTLASPPVAAAAPPPPQPKTTPVLRALFNQLQAAHANPAVSAIVVTGSGKNFSAGFDIAQFAKSNSGGGAGAGGGIDDTINKAICAVLEGGPKPTVAAVQGVALGGGLEVAMGCNARVAVKGARMGLPELQLGIIPGFGGTQRLPRLVGLQKSIEMMLTSKPVRAEQAAKLGLVDQLVDNPSDLLPAARAHALDVARGLKPRLLSLRRADRLPPFGEAAAMVDFARAEAAKRAPHLLHPQFCLDAVLTGIAEGGDKGLKAEGEAFAKSAALDTHKALVHVFFASRATKKIKGIEGVKPREIKRVAVIGGGLMGSGIATALVLNGVEVALKEISPQFLEAGEKRIAGNIASRVKKGRMTSEQAQKALSRVKGVLDYNDPSFRSADMVIEAVIEDVGLKQKIFVEVEKVVGAQCTLATNTSTIDLDLIGAKLPTTAAKKRIVGAHFFSPAHVMPLLEIVRTSETSPQAVVDTLAMGSIIKKTPVVVGNCTGFAVNRVFFPYTMAAMLLCDCGADPYSVDKVVAGFGMPMGPFRLNDLVGSGELVFGVRRAFDYQVDWGRGCHRPLPPGPPHIKTRRPPILSPCPQKTHPSPLNPTPTPTTTIKTKTDIGLHVGKNFVESFPERVYVSSLIPALNDAKRLGEKTKAGFYQYDDRRRAKPDPQGIRPLVEASVRDSGVLQKVFGGKAPKLSPQEIVEMIFFPVVNEGCRVIAEGIVDKPADLDIATVFAMGFPPYRGGLIFWADLVGAAKICEALERLAAKFAPVGADGFFAPCEYLKAAARSGRKLSAGVAPASRM
jgi:enoyl-CoA hydratase/3-hydroxyacyl-CoA dehydrogenase